MAEIGRTREDVRAAARRQLGITGSHDAATPPLREALRSRDLTFYPLVAIGLLAVVDTFQRYGFAVLAPDISRTLGIDKGVIAGVIALQTLAIAVAPLGMAALAQRHARRAMLAVLTAVVWSLFTIGTGFVTILAGLIVVLIVGGIANGSVHALHAPLLFDLYPPQARVRVMSTYQAFDSVGNVLAPLLVTVLAVAAGVTWRGVFVAMGVLSLGVCATASRLRDPGFGRWDEKMIRSTVQTRTEPAARATASGPPEHTSLRFFEVARRLLLIRTVRRLLAGYAVFGVMVVPFQTFLFFFLEERWNLGPAGRGLFFAGVAAAAIIGLAFFGRRAEIAFQRRPQSVVRFAGLLLAGGVAFIALGALAPWFWLMFALFTVAFTCIALFRPAITPALLGVVPSHMRPAASALAGIFLGGVGGFAGAIFMQGIDTRFGLTWAMVSLVIPAVLGAIVIGSAGALVVDDVDAMIDAVVEEEEIRRRTAAGEHLPMLACRGVDFSYGPLQVLFGVDFTVDDGEMVALLGVNGAGKSTLLRAISGIGVPTRGSVRFRGHDITYLDPERRVRLGITQVPGGRAVFGPLTVTENLRCFAYTVGRDRKALEQSIDRCFQAFPRLFERRDAIASTLSGGEQQMLGLSKALILRPRLLLIDELSLGLAPVVVGQLLEMVREINATGAAVVLVEQSVNIALNLVKHAYFMEKGEIRFDGPSEDLLARDDLLRAVFLHGAGAQVRA